MRRGLMSPAEELPAHRISARAILWSIALVLGAVELVLEFTLQ